ncbi:unnamed protein product, partial [Mesorhabditis belari]|uniref:RING-type domain-containing protein n=1 Tax=Mesorhabditis belari TaxID=2138241 RepID=A0AAF3FRC8_9BILA
MEKPVMQVFKAFNCSSCAVPLTIATDCTPRPNGNEACQRTCGEMICQACLTANRHHCGRVHCSTEISFVLKDLFNSGSLTLLPFLKGYILSRPISTPECSICYEEYSAYQPDLTPILLSCRHSICNRCVGKIKIIDYSAGHRLRCPLCQVMLASADCSQNQPLVQFIKELPEMTAQMENIQKNASIGIAKSYLVVDCSDCERKCPLTDNFYCNDCQVRICAKCTVLGHRTHSLTQMVEEEAKNLRDIIICFASRTS